MSTPRRWIFRGLIVVLALLASGRTVPQDPAESEAGRDIAAGTLRLKTYGLPASWVGSYEKLMKERLGVEIQWVAGCLVDDETVENVGHYNRRMEAEIARRFGPEAHARIQAEARKASGWDGP